MKEDKIIWIIQQHTNTNHMYDKYLPYEFHLRMAANVCKEFKHLLPNRNDGETSFREDVLLATWGHDLIEDTRVSYNDVKVELGHNATEIIYAVTNEKGRNRKERANAKYYAGIRETPGAVFVKLCDRIANVQYGIMTKSRTVEMYRKENELFEKTLGRYDEYSHLEPMFAELEKILEL